MKKAVRVSIVIHNANAKFPKPIIIRNRFLPNTRKLHVFSVQSSGDLPLRFSLAFATVTNAI